MKAATPATFHKFDAAHDAMMRMVMPAASAATPKDTFDYVHAAKAVPVALLAVAATGSRLVRPEAN